MSRQRESERTDQRRTRHLLLHLKNLFTLARHKSDRRLIMLCKYFFFFPPSAAVINHCALLTQQLAGLSDWRVGGFLEDATAEHDGTAAEKKGAGVNLVCLHSQGK